MTANRQAGIWAMPTFAWEISLAGWLIFKGFNPVAAASAPAGIVPNEILSAA